MKDYIGSLQKTIKRLHGCDSRHLESVPVKETFHGQTAWEGVVEVFELVGHPKAKRCYAWAHAAGKTDEKTRFVTVLGIPPVNSAQLAVRIAIVDEAGKTLDEEGGKADTST